VTVLEVIQRSAEFLARKGVESPRLQIELILAHALRMPRMHLYLNFEKELTPDELTEAREMVKRRGEREPLQHILGTTSFCGLEMAVNRHVLIPRPETEILAERAWTHLKGLAPEGQPKALDFGTGSGCLAIALAVHCPAAEVWAVDVSPEALEVARENALRHGVHERIQFHQGNGFEAIPPGTRFDLIVSNPPYIPTAEIETLQPEVRDHDPRQALDGGADGLVFYRMFATAAEKFLVPSGTVMLEFGDGQETAIREIFQTERWQVPAVEKDYTQRPRFLIAER
jgi:release factor glutamine methyltransferase